jgi:hypothetical protein
MSGLTGQQVARIPTPALNRMQRDLHPAAASRSLVAAELAARAAHENRRRDAAEAGRSRS